MPLVLGMDFAIMVAATSPRWIIHKDYRKPDQWVAQFVTHLVANVEVTQELGKAVRIGEVKVSDQGF